MVTGQVDVVLTLGLKPHSKDTKKTQKKICKAGGIQLFSLGFACWVCFSGGFCLSLSKSLFFSHLLPLCVSLAFPLLSLVSRIFLPASHSLPPPVTSVWFSPPPSFRFLSPESLHLPSLCPSLPSSLPLVLSPPLCSSCSFLPLWVPSPTRPGSLWRLPRGPAGSRVSPLTLSAGLGGCSVPPIHSTQAA